jgi:hypothetical protein
MNSDHRDAEKLTVIAVLKCNWPVVGVLCLALVLVITGVC